MDLVDIDKVLDDLEFNENKDNNLIKNNQKIQKNDNNLIKINSTNKNFIESEKNNSQSALESNEKYHLSQNESSASGKKFVAVSHVFSSLDDYCRDVESLDMDIQKVPQNLQLDNFHLTDGSNNGPEHLSTNENNVKITSSVSKDVFDVSKDDKKFDVPKNSDIHEEKFNEVTNFYNDSESDEDIGGFSKDALDSLDSSITTSSPSSFSSGPSSGNSLNDIAASVNSLRNSNKKEKKRKSNKLNEGNDDDENDMVSLIQNEQNEINIANPISTHDIDEQHSPELTTGLSSISSNLLQNDESISSLPDVNKLKVDSLGMTATVTNYDDFDCNYNEDINSIMSSDSLSGKCTAEENYLKQKMEPIGESNVKIEYEKLKPIDNVKKDNYEINKNVIVGFGSTMDEISDTELDSMLQEIDNELNYSNNDEKYGCDNDEKILEDNSMNKKPQNNELERERCDNLQNYDQESNDIDPKETYAPVSQQITIDSLNSTISTTNSGFGFSSVNSQNNKADGSVNDENHDDFQNADSFSQASTIEFAELRLQNDFGGTGGGGSSVGGGVGGENVLCDDDNNVEKADEIAIDIGAKTEIDEDSTSTNSGTKNLINANQPQRPNSLDLPVQQRLISDSVNNLNATAGQTPPASVLPTNFSSDEEMAIGGLQNITQLGKIQPFWIPDSEAMCCMQCKLKFTLIKRRHHCRACGQVLCSQCCSQKAKLEFQGTDAPEVRICVQCRLLLSQQQHQENEGAVGGTGSPNSLTRSPNPNNPMEYCSTIPPMQQVNSDGTQSPRPMSIMVPVGVLKRDGQPSRNKDKNVIFSDGIRPGCDLADLDNNWDDVKTNKLVKTENSRRSNSRSVAAATTSRLRKEPHCDENNSYISKEKYGLPPIYCKTQEGDFEFKEVQNNSSLLDRLQCEMLQFAVQRNLYIFVKIVKLKCCINKTVINFTTLGMHHVGQDEIIILMEHDLSTTQKTIPKDIFVHLNEIYNDADKGHPTGELGFSMPKQHSEPFLDSREHGGFLYIRSTFQCLQEIYIPESPFLIGILIHRWEVPWAKIFPLRLMLRLGAQYRYYPSPHISIRGRDSVYAEIAQTIINFLADFRNYSYTLGTIKGMYIHMEDRKTSVLIPRNRYDQILKSLNNSSDFILALGGNFSKKADGHLVCIQNMESDCPDSHTYSTQAINIQGQPRKVTGASFIVLNGALKSTSGLSGKCSIVEDGLMVQILPQKMQTIRTDLKNMKDVQIVCGPVDADESQTEIVCIQWIENDTEFNIGVKSPIDMKKMDGIPSIRVHSGLNYSNANHIIRWTEVFIIQSDDDPAQVKDPIDISKLSEQIASSTSMALVSFLDLMATSGSKKIGLRATLHQENVCYEAGSQNTKLAPLYMNALDNELIPTLHKQITSLELEAPIILELIFHILDK